MPAINLIMCRTCDLTPAFFLKKNLIECLKCNQFDGGCNFDWSGIFLRIATLSSLDFNGGPVDGTIVFKTMNSN